MSARTLKDISGLGVNVVLGHSDKPSLDRYFEAIIDLKFSWIRLELDFFAYLKGQLDWKAFDYFILKTHKLNLPILCLINGGVPGTIKNYLMPRGSYRCPLTYLKDIDRFVCNCLKRYGSFIKNWEIWNEPNTVRFWIKKPSPSEYLTLLRRLSLKIRQHQPKANIVLGGINGDDETRLAPNHYLHWYENLLSLKATKFFDVVNLHPYVIPCFFSLHSKEWYLDYLVNHLTKTIAKFRSYKPPRPLWITEFGISSVLTPGLNPNSIAEIYHRYAQVCEKFKVPLAFWVLANSPYPKYGPLNPERGLGFLSPDLKLKPLYHCFKTFRQKS